MTALSQQVGGNHYKGFAIQPVQLSMANHYDACIHSAIKYVGRHNQPTGKGRQDLEKARHFLYLRVETIDLAVCPRKPPCAREAIKIAAYIKANQIGPDEAEIITSLHQWAAQRIGLSDGAAADYIAARIDRLLDSYPNPKGQ